MYVTQIDSNSKHTICFPGGHLKPKEFGSTVSGETELIGQCNPSQWPISMYLASIKRRLGRIRMATLLDYETKAGVERRGSQILVLGIGALANLHVYS